MDSAADPPARAPAPAKVFPFAEPYALPRWPAAPRPAQDEVHDLVVVGGGLSGLTLACDLAQRGVQAVLLDDDDTVGVRGASSRGICYAQKSLEVFERLGVAGRIRARGVSWSVGNTFSGHDKVWSFNLRDDSVSAQPPFVNLQQFHLEAFLVERLQALGGVPLRWKHAVTGIRVVDGVAHLDVDTPEGPYRIRARWVVDATGVHSLLRTQLGIDAHTSRHADRWCITDVRFQADLPPERRTWIDAPFNDGRAVWQHPMADGVWRLDYQMAPEADPETVASPAEASRRLAAQLGPDVDLSFVWIGPYQYRDHLLDHFRHGPVFFIGDAAHGVSPFGARGGNTGIQDANNLGWKFAWVQRGWADPALLDTYHEERHPAAFENLVVTRRTNRFLAPRTPAELTLRRAVMALARHHAFARSLVNAGRMSVANDYPPCSAPLPQAFAAGGVSVQDVPLRHADGRPTSLMGLLRDADARALALCFGAASPPAPAPWLQAWQVGDEAAPGVDLVDAGGVLHRHLGVPAEGACVIVRPDAYRSR